MRQLISTQLRRLAEWIDPTEPSVYCKVNMDTSEFISKLEDVRKQLEELRLPLHVSIDTDLEKLGGKE